MGGCYPNTLVFCNACQWILDVRATSEGCLLQGVMAEEIGQHVSGFGNWLVTKHA